jgi:BirA family transcriptional regulator, biotin operon repressor / biotin---[acetyl-CoA-carboxylase] ligase
VALRQPGERTATIEGVSAEPGTFLSRIERFETVTSTNDIVAGWLASGITEVCVAVADSQSAGRGRLERSWQAPAGTALLCSMGFRPTWVQPPRTWRIAAVVALAMADAAEAVAGLAEGTIRLKWPNDLVVVIGSAGRPIPAAAVIGSAAGVQVRKLAGLLGETDGIGTSDPRVVVGIGINADWAREAFPAELRGDMTSLREASGGRSVDRAELLDEFLSRLEARVEALRGGHFDVAGWSERQLTSGLEVRLELPGGQQESVRAIGVDALSGALVVAGPSGEEREVFAGEIRHVRLAASGVGL